MCRVCLWHMTENRCLRWWWLDLYRYNWAEWVSECETKTTETIFRFYPTSYTCKHTLEPALCYVEKPLRQWILLNNNNHYTRVIELLIAHSHMYGVLSFSSPHFFTIKLCHHMSHARLHAHAHVYNMESTHMCAMMIGHTHLKFIHHNFPVERSF